MNNDRRKKLAAILQKIEDAKSELESLRDEEQDYYDNMPEGIQAGEKGDKSQTAIDAMESAIDDLDSVHSSIEEATQ